MGKSETAGMKVDELAQVGDILRCLVRDAGDVIMENQQDGLFLLIARKLLDVDDGAIGNAADTVEPLAAFPLEIFGTLRFAA